MSLTQSQFDGIMRIYERRREISRHNAEEAKRRVRETIPEYRVIEDKITDLAMDCAKRALEGDAGAVSKLRDETDTLVKKQKQLLSENGFPEDYLEEKHECPLCADTGYTDGMKKCRCLRQEILKLLYSQSNIEGILQRENFDTLSTDIYTDSEYEKMKDIIKGCRDFADDFGRSYSNILLYGNVGVGKTFLTNCMAKAVIDKGYSVIYFTSIRLFDTLFRENYRNGESDTRNVQTDLFTCDLLIIDDLGTENVNSFVESKLFDILNERDLRRKPTIISTNLTFEELGRRYTERSFSRIFGNYKILHPDVEDIRIRRKRAGF